MTKRTRRILLPLLGALLAVSAACAGDETSTPTATSSPTPTATTTATGTEAPAPTPSPTVTTTSTSTPTATSTPDEPTSTPTAAPPSAAYGERVVMRPGDEVLLESGRVLRFIAVVNDSRCPVDVQCIWAGEATIQLVLIGDASLPVDITMPGGGTTSVPVGDLTFEASDLIPAPRSTVVIAPADYAVTITVFGPGAVVPPR